MVFSCKNIIRIPPTLKHSESNLPVPPAAKAPVSSWEFPAPRSQLCWTAAALDSRRGRMPSKSPLYRSLGGDMRYAVAVKFSMDDESWWMMIIMTWMIMDDQGWSMCTPINNSHLEGLAMAHSLATVQLLSLSRSLSPKVHMGLKIVYMLKSELWSITKPLTTWEGWDESQPPRLAAATTALVYVCMYIMYTCRCVCMSVNYEEDILWYSTKLIHHNKRHKTRKQRTLSPFERESSYLFIKKQGESGLTCDTVSVCDYFVYAIVTSKRASKLLEWHSSHSWYDMSPLSPSIIKVMNYQLDH